MRRSHARIKMLLRAALPLMLWHWLCPFEIPIADAAQQAKIWRIGWLSPAEGPGPNHEAFLKQLKALGYEEGKNIHIEWAWVGQHPDQFPQAATRLVGANIDVLITQSQAVTLAAMKVTTTIPIVFVGVRDPVVAGIVKSLSHPGGNVTGLTLTPNAELVVKHVELLRAIAPGASRLAVFWNPDVPVQADVIDTIKRTAQTLGVAVQPFGVRHPGDIERSFEIMGREHFDGLLTLVEAFTYGQRPLIAHLAIANRLPTLFEVKDYVTDGGLLSYGVVYHEHFAMAANYVDRIIRGARPADLPVQQPAKLELVINLKTAKALGMTIPKSVLLRADEVVE